MQLHIISGNLTADATVKKDYLSMTVAENIRKQDGTDVAKYHRIMYRAKDPEKLKGIFLKGRSVLVSAYDYTSDAYIGEKDHLAHGDTTYWATRVDITGYPKSEQAAPAPAQPTQDYGKCATVFDEDPDPLPF